MEGIDAYISVGAPDFLHIPSHLEKVKTALTKSNTKKPYLLTAILFMGSGRGGGRASRRSAR